MYCRGEDSFETHTTTISKLGVGGEAQHAFLKDFFPTGSLRIFAPLPLPEKFHRQKKN